MKTPRKMRADIVRIVNNLSSRFLYPDYDFDLFKAYDTILSYCKSNNAHPRTIYVDMDGLVLIINGKHITNVARCRSMIECSEKACYWEEKILERQEEDYCD